MADTQPTRIEKLAKTIKKCVESEIAGAQGMRLTQDSETEVKDIIEFSSRMRVMGLDKFNMVCFVTCVNFYKTAEDKEAERAIGAMVMFALKEDVEKFIKGFIPGKFNEDDDEECMEKLNEIAKKFADKIATELKSQGYSSLVLGDAFSGNNDIPEGVPFEFNETEKASTFFYLWKVKYLSVEMTITPPAQ